MNPTCYEAHIFRDTSSNPAGEPNNHYCLADRRTLQSQPLLNHLPHSNQEQQPHYPNICVNDQEIAPIEHMKPLISETSLLASLMVEQPIIQAVISSIETFNGTKSKFES